MQHSPGSTATRTLDKVLRKKALKLFDDVVDLGEGERRAILIRECHGNTELLEYIDRLLAFHAASPDDEDDELPTANSHSTTWIPDAGTAVDTVHGQVGPYRILEVLGTGGMGVVYLAEQSEPVVRKVALKVVRSSLNKTSAAARFMAERQAMARMSHVNVAQMFEASTTEEGWPYFVMEYIQGEDLLDHCDNRQLDLRARLRLLMEVCQGVQHAHQRGVMHRDLKPSNVMVAELDGRAIPKVIDFGIAKALEGSLSTQSELTGQAVIGTPAYMSPESLHTEGDADVDTRSDVYALGVMLYELISGVRPFEDDTHVVKLLMRVAHKDASRPSARYREQEGAAQVEIAAARGMDARQLSRVLDGDLDWIAARAIARNPDERYATASELAADIERYLDSRAIEARPPSVAYRMRKFAHRNRLTVAAVAAVFAALVLGVVGTTAGMVQASREAAHASQQAARASQQAARANLEVAAANEVVTFMTEMFTNADPSQQLGASVTARELLDGSVGSLDELDGQPLLQARMMTIMGSVYHSLTLHDEARDLLGEALDTRRRLLDDPSLEVAETLQYLGEVQRVDGDFDAAEASIREVLATRIALLEGDHEEIAQARTALGVLLVQKGQLDAAQTEQEAALAMRRRMYGEEHERVAASIGFLGEVLTRQGQLAQAEAMHREALAIKRATLPADHPLITRSLHDLAGALQHLGRFEEALPYAEEAVATSRRVFGSDHVIVSQNLNLLAIMKGELDQIDEAQQLLRESIAILEATFGPRHPNIGRAKINLAHQYIQQNDPAAEPILRDAIDIFEEAHGREHPAYATGQAILAKHLLQRGEYQQAETAALEALEIRRRVLPPSHPSTIGSLETLGKVYGKMGRHGASEDAFREASKGLLQHFPAGHNEVLRANGNLARALGRNGKPSEAHTVFDGMIRAAEAEDKEEVVATIQKMRAKLDRELAP